MSSWVFDKHTRDSTVYLPFVQQNNIYPRFDRVCWRRFRHRLALAMNISHRSYTLAKSKITAQHQIYQRRYCRSQATATLLSMLHIMNKKKSSTLMIIFGAKLTRPQSVNFMRWASWNGTSFDHKLHHRYLNDPANERISGRRERAPTTNSANNKPPTKTWHIMLSAADEPPHWQLV